MITAKTLDAAGDHLNACKDKDKEAELLGVAPAEVMRWAIAASQKLGWESKEAQCGLFAGVTIGLLASKMATEIKI